jgi:hypothetical protein
MSDILDALLSGADYLGSAIGKPGRAVRGLLSGNTNEGLAALPFSDSLGITDPSQAVSGSQLLGQYGLSTGDSLADSALGFGAEMALDPTTYLGAGIAGKLLGRGAGAAATIAPEAESIMAKAASRAVPELAPGAGSMPTPGMKGLRDKIGLVSAEGLGPNFSTASRDFFGAMSPQARHSAADNLATAVYDAGYRGGYSPRMNMAAVLDAGGTGGWTTRRHEVMHGLIDQARKAGDSSGLPSRLSKVAASLPSPEGEGNPIMRALGLLADEAAAHAAEGRRPVDQLASLRHLFTDPNAVSVYGGQLNEISPLVAALYRNARYAPVAGAAGVGTIGGLGLAAAN